jgi:hypothetical protein
MNYNSVPYILNMDDQIRLEKYLLSAFEFREGCYFGGYRIDFIVCYASLFKFTTVYIQGHPRKPKILVE